MSSLNPAEVEKLEKLEKMLEGLEPECKHMNDQSRGFVEDQIKRFSQYGARIFISPKQMSWLENLYEKHVARSTP